MSFWGGRNDRISILQPPQEQNEKADFDLPEMPEARRLQVIPKMGTAGTNKGEKMTEDRPCVCNKQEIRVICHQCGGLVPVKTIEKKEGIEDEKIIAKVIAYMIVIPIAIYLYLKDRFKT